MVRSTGINDILPGSSNRVTGGQASARNPGQRTSGVSLRFGDDHPRIDSTSGILTLAVLVVLISLQTAVARAQSEFFDANSHVPPSPSNYDSPSRPTSVTVGHPNPTINAPPQSTSVKAPPYAYDHARSRNMASPARPTAPIDASRPSTAPSRSNVASRLNPFGIRRKPEASTLDHSRAVTPLGQVPIQGSASKAGFHPFDDAPEGFPPPDPPSGIPAPLLAPQRQPPGGDTSYPMDRVVPPMILGQHLRLPPGETATERSLRLMGTIGELEKQLDALGQQNAEQNQLLKHRDEQLLLAIREIKSARKDVATARDELERLRQQVQLLQDKVRDAERDNAALLQTMAPLLQRLLESDGTGGSTDEPEE